MQRSVLALLLFSALSVALVSSVRLFDMNYGPSGPQFFINKVNLTTGYSTPVSQGFPVPVGVSVTHGSTVWSLAGAGSLQGRSLDTGAVVRTISLSPDANAALQNKDISLIPTEKDRLVIFAVVEWDGSSPGPFKAALVEVDLTAGSSRVLSQPLTPGFTEAGPTGPFQYVASHSLVILNLRLTDGNPMLVGYSTKDGRFVFQQSLGKEQIDLAVWDEQTATLYGFGSQSSWISPSNRSLYHIKYDAQWNATVTRFASVPQFTGIYGAQFLTATRSLFMNDGQNFFEIDYITGHTRLQFNNWCYSSFQQDNCTYTLLPVA